MEALDTFKTLALVGKPLAGKETQGKLLTRDTGYTPFSSGKRFREIKNSGLYVGQKIAPILDVGGLMPHWFAEFVFIEKAISLSLEDGIIYDGMGRKLPEAKLFHEVMQWLGRPYKVIHLNISDEESLNRLERILSGQMTDREKGRPEDSIQAHKFRIQAFHDDTAPAIHFFEEVGTLITVNGEQEPEAVHAEILQKFSVLN